MSKSQLIRPRYIFVFALVFFIFILYLFLLSFSAEYNIYLNYLNRMQTRDPFWTSFWFASELVGEVGLFFRFFGACFFLIFAWILVKNNNADFLYLKFAVLFEGIYYLFIIPFIVDLYLRPNTGIAGFGAALSYTLQILFITPAFLILFSRLRKTTTEKAELFRWGGVAVVGYTFGLWFKHFIFMLYALPIDFGNPILFVGTLNSALTIFIAALVLVAAFLPIIKKQTLTFNTRLAGLGFLLIGLHFIIYFVVALQVQRYWNFMMLTEFWALGFLILGIGYIVDSTQKRS